MTSSYTLDDYRCDVKGDLQETAVLANYTHIVNLYSKLNTPKEIISRDELVNMLENSLKVIEYLRCSGYKIITCRVYTLSLIAFSKTLGVNNAAYHKYYDELCKVHQHLIKTPIMTDEEWEALQSKLDARIQRLPKDCERMCDKMEYQKTILMLLYLRLPARKKDDIKTIKNGDDNHSNYYDQSEHTIVYRHNGNVSCRVPIPEKYHWILDKYTASIAPTSLLFFTERKGTEYNGTNFSVFGKKAMGTDFVAIRQKWKDIIVSTPEGAEKRQLLEWF